MERYDNILSEIKTSTCDLKIKSIQVMLVLILEPAFNTLVISIKNIIINLKLIKTFRMC